MIFSRKKKIYLDYASCTPVDRNVVSLMHKIQSANFANPSSIHSSGVESKSILNEARNTIARLLNAHDDEIVFTSSGTSSIALALYGVVHKYKKDQSTIPHIIVSSIEHKAVLSNAKYLKEKGYIELSVIDCESDGIIDVNKIKEAIRPNTLLVSVMYANNEIGTIQRVQDIAKVIRHYRKDQKTIFPFFHTDACQAMNYLYTSNIEKLGVDLMSFNSPKIYGPKGVGVLYKKRSISLEPMYLGGGQEYNLYSGTEDVASIAGAALALKIANSLKTKENIRLTKIRDYAIDKIKSLREETKYIIRINGHEKERLPNNINISIDGISSELLVIELDAYGIEVSEKSACGSSDSDYSHVIHALYKDHGPIDFNAGSLRISLGKETSIYDIDILISKLKSILDKYSKWK